MITPVCQKCIYLSHEQEKFRKCPHIPIFHRDMLCSNPANARKDYVDGEPYKPYCQEVNRHGECLVYMPRGLAKPTIIFNDEDNKVTIAGASQIVFTTDGTEPTAETPSQNGNVTEGYPCVVFELLEHSCTVKAACVIDGVMSEITELYCEIPDTPTIDFDKSTNTVTINSYNKVYYTLDGTKPNEESAVYEKPFVLERNATVKCVSYAREDFSEVVSGYCVTIEAPVIRFDPETRTVSIEADDKILYSTDGSDIYDDADEYDGEFEIEDDTAIKAACIVDGELSEQTELFCKVPSVPVIEYDQSTKTVTIKSNDDVLYTIDGSDVRKKSLAYTAPFKITETVRVKARSLVDGVFSEQSEKECVVVPSPEITFDPETNTVSITGTEKILYTTDGKKVYDDEDEYTSPFVIDRNTTVSAACIKDGILSDQVTLVCKVASKPAISFDARTKTVSISGENTILYTTDGSDVKKKDSEYTKAFKITETTTVKARSIVDGKMSEQAELECVI